MSTWVVTRIQAASIEFDDDDEIEDGGDAHAVAIELARGMDDWDTVDWQVEQA